MPRYSVSGAVHGSTWIGEYDANTPEEAIELAYNDAGISLCHECARKVSDPEVLEFTAEDVETGDATSEKTIHDQIAEQAKEIERLTECNDAMREPMRKLRDVMGMPAQGEGYVVDSIIEDRARLQRIVWDYEIRFSLLAKIARGVEEKVGRYLEYHGPSCDEHEDEPDEFCATCRMDTAANDAISELKFWSKP